VRVDKFSAMTLSAAVIAARKVGATQEAPILLQKTAQPPSWRIESSCAAGVSGSDGLKHCTSLAEFTSGRITAFQAFT